MKKYFVGIIIAVGLIGMIALGRFKTKSTSASSVPSVATTATTTSSTPSNTASTTTNAATYKDGSYTGTSIDVGYGVVEVQAIVAGGKLSDVKYLSLPSGGHSSMVSGFAGPQLRSEALSAQSAKVDIVSGATSTSEGFQMSLQAALNQAS